MPKQSIEVFCKYEADDGVAPLGHDELSCGVEEEDRETYNVPGFKADIAVQANR